MKKNLLTLTAFALFTSGIFSANYEIDLNKAAQTIKMEDDFAWENGIQTTKKNGCKVQIPISEFLNNATLKNGDKLHITGSGSVDNDFRNMICAVIDNSEAAGWKELSKWGSAGSSKKGNYSINLTLPISKNAESGQNILLFFHADTPKGLPTLTARKAESSSAVAKAEETKAESKKEAPAKKESAQKKESTPKKESKKTAASKSTSEKKNVYSIDVSMALPIRFLSFEASNSKFDENIIALGWKAQTYDFFWLDGRLGIYASLGIGFQMAETSRSIKTGGITFKGEDTSSGVFNFSAAFGPSFGTYLGSTGIRFNIGAGLHILCQDFDEPLSGVGSISGNAVWMGFDVNPQLRFTSNRRCSFVLGCEMAIDGCVGGELSVGGYGKRDIKDIFDSSFQFMLAPYLGLGFNF